MYRIFEEGYRSYQGVVQMPYFVDVSKRIIEDVEHVKEYYRSRGFSVPNEHLLVKLIKTMSVPLHYDIDHYYEVASARSLYVANALQLTTAIAAGKWFDGVFYYGCPEIILAYNGSDRPSELEKGWRNLQPVRVLECPVSNMRYMLPNGKEHNTETGICVIAIDIPQLMIQYRSWHLAKQAALEAGQVENLGIPHFVMSYVIPNMLMSQTDLMLSNRVMNLFYGAPMGDSTKKHVFHVSDYTQRLDRGLNDLVRRLSTLPMDYETVLAHLPKVYGDHPYTMPDIAETRQVWWALFTTRFKMLEFLIDVGGPRGKSLNMDLVNQLRNDFKRFKSTKVLEQHLPMEILDPIMYFFKTL